MKNNVIPRRTQYLWQIRLGIFGFVITVVLFSLSAMTIWFTVGGAASFAVFAVLIFWYVPTFFKSYRLDFPDGAIVIERGIFIKTCHIMPYSRLVYAKSISTPLAKKMGLCAISLKAARTTVTVPEIFMKDAEKFVAAATGDNLDE